MQVFGEPDLFSRAIFPDDVQGPVHSTPAPAQSAPAAPSPSAPSLTEEQRCRMELNRQRALEKRLARQQQQQEQQEMGESSVMEEKLPTIFKCTASGRQ